MPILAAILGFVGPILERIIPDPNERMKVMTDLMTKLQSLDLAQIEVNKVEAGNENIFVSGWRPAIGWCCAIAVAYAYIVRPFGISLFSLFKPEWATILLNMPSIDNNLWELMFAMLGLGALRSIEKVKGIVK